MLLTPHGALVVLVGPALVISLDTLTVSMMALALEVALHLGSQIVETDGTGLCFGFSQSSQPLNLLIQS